MAIVLGEEELPTQMIKDCTFAVAIGAVLPSERTARQLNDDTLADNSRRSRNTQKPIAPHRLNIRWPK